jgi:tetratricopeptide (TPR) repeat protein
MFSMTTESVSSLVQQARTALARGDARAARQCYLQALAVEPESVDIHYGLATACFLLDDLGGASHYFLEVIRQEPTRADAYTNLGAVFNRLGRLEDSVKCLRRGIALEPTRAEAHYNLGVAYRRLQKHEQAARAYLEAVRLSPGMADAHFNLGNIFFELGRFRRAILCYQNALKVNPHFDKAQESIRKAEELLALQPGNGQADHFKLDPKLHGLVLRDLHQSTIDSQSHGRELLHILEKELEAALAELTTAITKSDRSAEELMTRVRKFEAIIQNLRSLQRNLQQSMKRMRECGTRFGSLGEESNG